MSRVTIKDLFWEISQDRYASNVWDGYKDIEVVPRKMVEMIIERCEGTINCACYSEDNMRVWEARDLKEYAESLLEKFENDGQI